MEKSLPEDAFDVPPEHILQSSQGKGWQGVDIADIIHPLDDFALPALPRHILVINLGSPLQAHECLHDRHGHLETGSLTILPAGAPSTWHLEREGEVRHLHLYLSPSFISRVALEADINPDRIELLQAIGVPAPQVEAIALSYLAELHSDGLGGKIYTESLANLLAVHLLRHHSSLKQIPAPRQHGLHQKELRKVLTYIDEHLAENVSLSDLAAMTCLSPYYFARLFKQSTGQTPHQYLIRRRVERARQLISATNLPITAIAHTVGFASESHLAQHVKRITGLTPSHYRS